QRDRSAVEVAISSFIRAINQESRLLEFYRQEEGSGGVDAFHFATLLVGTARFDVVYPEVESGFVGFAAEEIEILLAHKVRSCIQRIQSSTSGRAGEDRVRVRAQLTEASLRWAETEVG